jgi:hypothetical protein
MGRTRSLTPAQQKEATRRRAQAHSEKVSRATIFETAGMTKRKTPLPIRSCRRGNVTKARV